VNGLLSSLLALAVALAPAALAAAEAPEAAPAKAPAAAPAAPPEAAPEVPLVTVSFSGVDLLGALHRLFIGTGLRYEYPKDAKERFSASFEDVPLGKALRALLEPYAYTFTREGDLYRVTRKEGSLSVQERLEKDRKAHEREWWIAQSKKPPRVEGGERSRVRFADASSAGFRMPRFSLGRQAGPYRGGVLWTTAPAVPYAPWAITGGPIQSTPRREGSRSLQLGPWSISLPEGLTLLPGGGWELFTPAEGEASTTGPLGMFRVPFTGGGGLTIGQKRR